MTAPLLRFCLPQRGFTRACLPELSLLRSPQVYRNASSSASKPRVLEKPTKFNPPSHPARLNRAPPRQYQGPALSAPELEAQKTRKYPHMFPAEGTFMRWFLTNRSIHTWITLSVLLSLALFTTIVNFNRTSPFAHLIPPAKSFFSHPIGWVSQCIQVFKLHTQRISEETAERRRKKIEDVQKRKQYRKAHGLDKGQGDSEDGAYVDFEGRKKPVKKWLGIW